MAQICLPSKIIITKENVYNKITIANKFNKNLANVGPTAAKIPPVTSII